MQSRDGLLSRGEGIKIRRLRFLEDVRQSSGEKGTMQEKKLIDLRGESSLLYILRRAQDTILQSWAKNDWAAIVEWLPELRMG